MKICLLVDNEAQIAYWEYLALEEALTDGHTIDLILKCNNPKKPKKKFRNLFYFAIALWSRLTLRLLKRSSISEILNSEIPMQSFSAIDDGVWQKLPIEICQIISEFDVVLKFGMGLLRVTDEIKTPHGIWSYHHGDPGKYRGRPAAFYEIENNEKICGVIIQKITNTLDAGEVKAIGHSKVLHHSYIQSLGNLYATGIPLLKIALRAPELGFVETVLGTNYRLPSNWKVCKYLFRMTKNKVAHFVQRVFFSRNWRISKSHVQFTLESDLNMSEVETYQPPKGVRFLADPIGVNLDEVFCEGMIEKSELGEIFHVSKGEFTQIDFGMKGHKSYPFTFQNGNDAYIIPELSGISSPHVFRLQGTKLVDTLAIRGLQTNRIVDPTLFFKDDFVYLFGGELGESNNILRLFIAKDIRDIFHEHPASPIRLNPQGARMGGPIANVGGRLFRFGQDNSGQYGDGLLAFEITEINENTYSEVYRRNLKIQGLRGPHTLSLVDGGYYFDHYSLDFSLSKTPKYIMARIKNYDRKK